MAEIFECGTGEKRAFSYLAHAAVKLASDASTEAAKRILFGAEVK